MQTGSVARLCLIVRKAVVFTLLALLEYAKLVEACAANRKVAASIRDVNFH